MMGEDIASLYNIKADQDSRRFFNWYPAESNY